MPRSVSNGWQRCTTARCVARYIQAALSSKETHTRYIAALSMSMDAARAAEIATAQIAQALVQQSALLANIDHFRALAIIAVAAISVSLIQKVIR